MNKNLMILAGFGLGAWAGWFVGSVIAEIILIKEAGEDKYDDTEEFPQDSEDMNMPIQGDVLVKKEKAVSKKVVKNYTQFFKDQPELAKLVEKYNGEGLAELAEEPVIESSSEEESAEEFDIPVDEKKVEDPCIISLSEYANAGDEYECLTLNYYDDDVVTDEHDTPIDRPERFLGPDALVSFGQLSQDDDVVYVRNNRKHAMYEIVRTNKNYSVTPERYIKKKAQKREEEENDGEGNT